MTPPGGAAPRRGFFRTLAGTLAGATLATPATELFAEGTSFGPFVVGSDRLDRAYAQRLSAAERLKAAGMPAQSSNGDDARYPALFATYTKGLPHDADGHVEPYAVQALQQALASGDPAALDDVPLGAGGRPFVNPLAGFSFDTEGLDPQQHVMSPAPAFASKEAAAEMVELYWMSLLRDVPFHAYESSPAAHLAAAELSSLSAFRGPRENGQVTPRTLFRDDFPGTTVGPYVSQFLWLRTPYGAETVDRRIRPYADGVDYGTRWEEWLAIQNGFVPRRAQLLARLRHVRSGRDLARWVHVDVLFQAYFNACLILGTPRAEGGLGCPMNPANPYLASRTQAGFGTWGPPFFKALLCEVATRALKAVWFQKWFVHRRLRPEAFAARVHRHRAGAKSYPLAADVLNAKVVDRVTARTGAALLPLAFPEGSPTHPSYGSGHATVAGACVTVLKALLDERFVIPVPVVLAPTGELRRWTGAPLTVGGELHKLASNVATGRNHAGVHWRSDARESILLGERVAIEVLKDTIACGPETLPDGIRFTGFRGDEIHVTA